MDGKKAQPIRDPNRSKNSFKNLLTDEMTKKHFCTPGYCTEDAKI